MDIRCGTAGWTDKTLIACKRFYPRGSNSAEARLRFYASQFPLLEVDSAYYAMPSASNAQLWSERTPEGFTFNFKAFRLFTGHQTSPDVLPKDIAMALPEGITGPRKKNLYYRDIPAEVLDELWRRYREALEPLRASGRLGAVLFQFAPWITRAPDGLALVEDCRARMAGYMMAAEFRNQSWFDDQHAPWTLDFLRERGLVHVIVDAPPDVTSRVHTVWEATHPQLAMVRLHGRNTQTWSATGAASAADRFDYDYSDDELTGLAPSIRAIATRAGRTHVIFNNCFEDQGQRNARSLMRILGSDLAPLP
ncbi:hypothetical protein DSC91_001900 [Paraburkholderia caffeinilytica]|uniref:DUF72 domain-containing protein n=1 Tax=Paraburkholderia caffeinilytica TaxID=1761016 RepID=A0ABQ1MDP7_9BURK|nr:DUF72 domain-containing protein [Paraburkholderia caffeinilytica]AXL49917.1 hypothetical protein DSC91_001900 [Paraburkholderia caffeinilytica]GGC38790.1 hypothetical protein GCM10011400_26810 [Paraburkholderia caffeinilytica]CAB3786243.1 hypothetical protein LMG28690_02187 [Paraburkholderia caffeinilytica]